MITLLEDGKSIAAWMEIVAFLGTLSATVGTLWLRTKFVSRAEMKDELKETITSFQNITWQKIDTVGRQVDESHKRIDEIVKLLIDRLPRNQ